LHKHQVHSSDIGGWANLHIDVYEQGNLVPKIEFTNNKVKVWKKKKIELPCS
jgi:hypothetical protein